MWEPDSSGDGGAGEAASPGKPGSHNTFTARLGLALTSTYASAFCGSPIHRAMAAPERPHRPASLAPT